MRMIARLDVKNNHVIKGIHLEGLRKVGSPIEMATKYYQAGADEILIMDAVASLYDRNNLFDIIEETCKSVFIPVCLGGGIRSINDIRRALDCGADKVAINTSAIKDISLISKAAKVFGSQAIVGSVEAKRFGDDYFCYYDNGREPTTIKVVEWIEALENHGVGEILVTSVDAEGTRKGLDMVLIDMVEAVATVPLVWSGGIGSPNHIEDARSVGAQNFAVASVLHYNLFQPFSDKNNQGRANL